MNEFDGLTTSQNAKLARVDALTDAQVAALDARVLPRLKRNHQTDLGLILDAITERDLQAIEQSATVVT